MASTLAVDGGSGDVVVCGSTTGVSIEGNGPGGSQGTAEDVSGSQGKGDKKKAPFCLKLATGNGQVSCRFHVSEKKEKLVLDLVPLKYYYNILMILL